MLSVFGCIRKSALFGLEFAFRPYVILLCSIIIIRGNVDIVKDIYEVFVWLVFLRRNSLRINTLFVYFTIITSASAQCANVK